jgi:HD-like signal output (HDOD) protein
MTAPRLTTLHPEVEAVMSRMRPPPLTLTRLLIAISRPDVDLNAIAAIVTSDPVVAARLLMVANSPYYRPASGAVKSINEAMLRLGLVELVRFASGILAQWLGEAPISAYAMTGDDLRRSSLTTAVAAEAIATFTDDVVPQVAFTAGLLLDVGKLALTHFLAECAGNGERFDNIERAIVGIDHAEAGAILGARWGLPEIHIAAIAGHHHFTPGDPPLVHACHVASAIALTTGAPPGIDGWTYPVEEGALAALDLDEAKLDRIAATVVRRVEAMTQALEGP